MKILIRTIVILLVLLVVVAISLPFLVDANQFRPRLETELTKALGRQAKVGDLKLDIFSGSVSANELSVADDPRFSPSPFLHAKSLKLTVELWPLISSRKLHVMGLLIDQPEISLIQAENGDWNFSGIGARRDSPPAQTAPTEKQDFDLSANLIKIVDGRLSIGHAGSSSKPETIQNVNVEIHDFSPPSAFPFSVSAKVVPGGDFKLDGKAGPINSTDVAATPVQANLSLSNLQLAASGFVDKTSGIDGLMTIGGSGNSNGEIAQWKGTIKADKLKLARGGTPATRPVQFDFTLEQNLRRHAGTLNRGLIHIGGASANLSGTWAQRGPSTVLNLHLSGPSMPIAELVTMLPPLDVSLPAGSSLQGGTADVNVTMGGALGGLTTTGSVALNNTRLTGFDLGSKMSAIERVAGVRSGPNTEIQTLRANVQSSPAGTTADHIQLVVPALGQLGGGGTISPAKALDFKMLATLNPSAGVLAGLGKATIPFFIQGTASAPEFKPDVQGIAASEIKRLDKQGAVKAATGILGGILGGKKKP